jgi:hypothetical protein
VSDERPEADAQGPLHETPAPEDGFDAAPEREPAAEPSTAPAMTPVRQGIRAALIIFAAAVGLELLGIVMVKLSSDPRDAVVTVFFYIGMIVFVVGLWTAMTVSNRLPPAARGPFWAMGVLCAFLSMILWGVTCAVSATPRLN